MIANANGGMVEWGNSGKGNGNGNGASRGKFNK